VDVDGPGGGDVTKYVDVDVRVHVDVDVDDVDVDVRVVADVRVFADGLFRYAASSLVPPTIARPPASTPLTRYRRGLCGRAPAMNGRSPLRRASGATRS